MPLYAISYEDYKEYFNENTKIDENDEEVLYVNVQGIKNDDDEKYEFSIEWSVDGYDEGGVIYSINTSSRWALKSCGWKDLDELDSD